MARKGRGPASTLPIPRATRSNSKTRPGRRNLEAMAWLPQLPPTGRDAKQPAKSPTRGRPDMQTSDMAAKIAAKGGFIAALDQSGGSTPRRWRLWRGRLRVSGDDEMYAKIPTDAQPHLTSPSSPTSGDRRDPVRKTGRSGRGKTTPQALIDRGMVTLSDRPGPGETGGRRADDEADARPRYAAGAGQRIGVFGTKERSVINEATKGHRRNRGASSSKGPPGACRRARAMLEPEYSIKAEGRAGERKSSGRDPQEPRCMPTVRK